MVMHRDRSAPLQCTVEVPSASRASPIDKQRSDASNSPLPHIDMVMSILSFGKGAADAFALYMLGGVFTANMTGNAVPAGLLVRPDYPEVAGRAPIAAGGFTAAIIAGLRLTRPTDAAPDAARSCMLALPLINSCQSIVNALGWLGPPREPGRSIFQYQGIAGLLADPPLVRACRTDTRHACGDVNDISACVERANPAISHNSDVIATSIPMIGAARYRMTRNWT